MNLEDAYPRKKLKRPNRPSAVLTGIVAGLCTVLCAGLVIPNLLGRPPQTRGPSTYSDIMALCGAIDQFRLDCGRYPTTREGLRALEQRPPGALGWRGPYLKQQIPKDPWGNPYHYANPGSSGHGYQVASYGADGKPGGEGDDADIVGGSDT